MIGTEPLAHPLEREREAHLFEGRIDRRLGSELLAQARQTRIGVLAETLGVRLRALVGGADERPRQRKEVAVEPGAALDPRVRDVDVAPDGVRLRDVIPCRSGRGLQGRVGIHGLTQLLLISGLPLHQAIVEQGEQLHPPDLVRVLDRVQIILGLARRLGRALRVLNQAAAQLGESHQPERQHEVALGLELLDGEEPLRGARMAGDKRRLALFRAVPVERQVVGDGRRLAVFIDAKQRHVETPARELKVVGVAAERRHRVLRRERQPHVVVALVFVEPVLTALVERDRLALQRRAALLRLLFTRGFEFRDRPGSGPAPPRPAARRRRPWTLRR